MSVKNLQEKIKRVNNESQIMLLMIQNHLIEKYGSS